MYEREWSAGRDEGWGGFRQDREARGGGLPRQWRGGAESGFADEWLSRPIYGPERYGLGPYHERLRRRRRPDDEVEREVKDALFYDTWIDADAITVEVRDGIVTLRGTLPSYDEIRYANDDAWDVEGVLGVHSELDVRE
jgi:hypothetical protein